MNKLIKAYGIGCLLLLCSCAATKRLRKEKTAQETMVNRSTTLDSSMFQLISHKREASSERMDISLEIVPEGIVDYHPEKGFVGKAKQIRVYTRGQKATTIKDSQSTVAGTSSHQLAEQQNHYSSRAQIKSYSATTRPWWLIGIVLLLGLLFWAFLKIKSRLSFKV